MTMAKDCPPTDTKKKSRLLAPILIACGGVLIAGTIALLGNSYGHHPAISASSPPTVREAVAATSGAVAVAPAPARKRPSPPRFVATPSEAEPAPVLATSEPADAPAPRHPLQAAPPPVELSAAEAQALQAQMAEAARRHATDQPPAEPVANP
jgi:hypothetical protein